MPRGRLQYILIPIAALIPILPLLFHGCSCGHDFDFHLLSWLEAAQQFRHGNLHPTWAFTPAWGAGEPRFIFYPPLSWTIGGILGLIFPWTWTPILYTWMTLTAAGLALYRLARAFTTQTAALLAASFYLVNPYTLFTAYERTAYAELLAAVWIPLLLYAILRPRVTIPRIAIPIALLWLTNAPAAVMSCYALALLTTIRLATTAKTTTNPGVPCPDSRTWASREGTTASPRLQLAINVITGTLLGIGIAAFYIVPAAYERRYVLINMAIIPNMRVQDNFLFYHSTNLVHDQVLHTASIVSVLMLALTAVALLIVFLNPVPTDRVPHPSQPHLDEGECKNSTPLSSLLTLTIAIALLLTPLTKFIWLHAPELAFLQFPWRTVAILAAVLSLTIALALRSIRIKPAVTTAIALTIATALTIPAYRTFHQFCDEEDNVTARVALFHSNRGTEPTDEYTPITADNDALAQINPPYWFSPNPDAPPPPNSQPGPAPHSLTFDSPIRQFLILNLRNYPAWYIYRNNDLTRHNNRNDGLTAILIPPGHSNIRITHAILPDQIAGAILSLISLAILIEFLRRRSAINT